MLCRYGVDPHPSAAADALSPREMARVRALRRLEGQSPLFPLLSFTGEVLHASFLVFLA
jgi:hypothetical protein